MNPERRITAPKPARRRDVTGFSVRPGRPIPIDVDVQFVVAPVAADEAAASPAPVVEIELIIPAP